MLPTNINLIASTKILAKTPAGDATLTFTPGDEETTCAVLIVMGGQELRKSKSFATDAGGLEKLKTVGPLLQSAMKKIGADAQNCQGGLPVEVSVLHDGQWVTLKRTLNLTQSPLGQLGDLIKYITRVNTKVNES